MLNLRLSFDLGMSHTLRFRLNRAVFSCAFFLLTATGCTPQDSSNSQMQNNPSQKSEPISESSPQPSSSIPNEREFDQQKTDVNKLLKESEQLEREANGLIGDKVPSGEQVYQDLSKGKCGWLKQRAEFYGKFADNLNQQANQMVPGSSTQAATVQQAEVARQRATSFQNEVNRRCSGQ